MRQLFGFFLVLGASISPALSDKAHVVGGTVVAAGNNSYNFSATVRHEDAGWDHYADRWEILSEDGALLGVRELAHPHVNEQPFTRSLRNVKIPEDIDRVILRARDSVHGYGGREFELTIPR